MAQMLAIPILGGLTTVGGALSVAAPVLSGVMALGSGLGQASALEAQADQARFDAEAAEVAASADAAKERRRNRVTMSRQRAIAGEAGALSGTTIDLLDSNAVALEQDALMTEYEGRLRGFSLRQNASNLEADAAGARTGAYFGLATGLIGGASAGANLAFDPLSLDAGLMADPTPGTFGR